MQDLFLRMYVGVKCLVDRDNGQSMTEYAMTASLIAFGCVAGESAIATSVNQIFITLGTIISDGVLR